MSLSETWPWYVAGPLIALVMALLVLNGKTFGASSNLRTLCAVAGARAGFFDYDWRAQRWNLVVMAGAALGAALATWLLDGAGAVPIGAETVAELEAYGIADAGDAYAPGVLFGAEAWTSTWSLATLVVGGLLIGFGTRWAGGCTSGHAITGLSQLQFPSLVAVIGFFAGGLLATHLILPYLLPRLAAEVGTLVTHIAQ